MSYALNLIELRMRLICWSKLGRPGTTILWMDVPHATSLFSPKLGIAGSRVTAGTSIDDE